MTRRPPATAPAARPAVALVAGLALGLAVLSGCDSQGVQTDCSLDACTLTFDRGVEANAKVLGVEAKLVGADGEKVTLEVAGERVSARVGEAAKEVGGMRVSVERVTDGQVVVKVAR
jgi:hypothetical protein